MDLSELIIYWRTLEVKNEGEIASMLNSYAVDLR
jgi:hypothetical protein